MCIYYYYTVIEDFVYYTVCSAYEGQPIKTDITSRY